MKKRTLLILKSIKEKLNEDEIKKIEDITEELIIFYEPEGFLGNGNFEVKYDKEFENMSLLMAKHLNVNTKKMSVLEYYNAFEFLRNSIKKNTLKNSIYG